MHAWSQSCTCNYMHSVHEHNIYDLAMATHTFKLTFMSVGTHTHFNTFTFTTFLFFIFKITDYCTHRETHTHTHTHIQFSPGPWKTYIKIFHSWLHTQQCNGAMGFFFTDDEDNIWKVFIVYPTQAAVTPFTCQDLYWIACSYTRLVLAQQLYPYPISDISGK